MTSQDIHTATQVMHNITQVTQGQHRIHKVTQALYPQVTQGQAGQLSTSAYYSVVMQGLCRMKKAPDARSLS